MHWWHVHPEGDKGIRSRCSDDLLWLCWAVCEYAEKTGDLEFLHTKTSFVKSPVLKDNEDERYEVPDISSESADILYHVEAALSCCEARGLGPHGLPFFGSGDWNDGLNKVDGESVWLGWFYSVCALRYSELLIKLNRPDASHYAALAESLGKAADKCFNGRFYYRGFHSDGSPLGGEDRIDSLSQSWAQFNPFADRKKVKIALRSAVDELADKEHSLVKLFSPPYSPEEQKTGYISSYGEGFRENGGQYTHGAVWLASALLKAGMAKEGQDILLMLLPENHDLSVYEAEPYVLSADVYSASGHEGEAGWSWYTGSAGWYFRVVIEDFLGLEMKDGKLLPPEPKSDIASFKAEFRASDSDFQEIDYPII